jgi:uncharacterized membrane protein YgdD (TMEM256/DUF423 family)
MSRPWLVVVGVLGAVTVMLGAFGAHGLRAMLSPERLGVYQTGIQYLQVHVLALLGVALLLDRYPERRRLAWVAWAFVAGCIFFSGSLLILAVSGLTWLGVVVPLGGLAWIVGWLLLASAFVGRAT